MQNISITLKCSVMYQYSQCLPFTPSPWQALVIFNPCSFAFSRKSHKWNHVVGSFLNLASFAQLNALELLSITYTNSSFFYITEQYSVIGMYHNLYAHSPADRHLGCLQFGAIINKAAINTSIQSFCGTISSFLLGKYQGMEMLGPIVNVCNVFIYFI